MRLNIIPNFISWLMINILFWTGSVEFTKHRRRSHPTRNGTVVWLICTYTQLSNMYFPNHHCKVAQHCITPGLVYTLLYYSKPLCNYKFYHRSYGYTPPCKIMCTECCNWFIMSTFMAIVDNIVSSCDELWHSSNWIKCKLPVFPTPLV